MISTLGIVSLKLTPVRSVAPLGFVIVKVSVMLLFSCTVAAENCFAIVGGETMTAPAVVPMIDRKAAAMIGRTPPLERPGDPRALPVDEPGAFY